ncbi:MAG: T9SS type A sorting domain-containing protein [Calditrichaeota bacterium]|nr:T9SS type A sorting domain-containing protein [Calditrichota bacterium]
MYKYFLVFIVLAGVSLSQAQAPQFSGPIFQGIVQFDEIDEASGIAASQLNSEILWTHNDSGDSARIFAMNIHGQHRGVVTLADAENRDWEDIAVGPGPAPGVSYIYVADIGDNYARYPTKYIYRFPEPKFPAGSGVHDTTITNFARIAFQLQDGARDTETLLSDPFSGDLYIVSKRETNVRVYRLPFPQDTTNMMVAHYVATLPITYLVGGDISHSGEEILLKTYTNVFFWQRDKNKPLWESLAAAPDTLPYTPEPQGEAICWAKNDSGYFTVSEEMANIPANLFFYQRLHASGMKIHSHEQIDFFLGQNYPNPFNQRTKIPFSLQVPARAKLQILNLPGQCIATLIDENLAAGTHLATWTGKNFFNATVSSGCYVYRLSVNHKKSQTGKLLFLK